MKEGEFGLGSHPAGIGFLRARKSHDAILRFLPTTPLSQEEKADIDAKLAELTLVLRSIGENV